MSERIGKLVPDGSLFGMNCTRHVNEPQITEYIPAAAHREATLYTSYLEIDQIAETYACVLSRAEWAWGAEMGVNENGVSIGLSEVKKLRRVEKAGLIGMDLLRLGLERSATAFEAVLVIIALLERYGQGGNTGYARRMDTDSSFLILDRNAVYVLETADRSWAYRKLDSAALSSGFIIAEDGDAYSDDQVCDFRKRHGGVVRGKMNGAFQRAEHLHRAVSGIETIPEACALLSGHRPSWINPMKHGIPAGPCMHAGGFSSVGTTASLVSEVRKTPRLWLTGSSAPCISLYKPWCFSCKPVAPIRASDGTDSAQYWLQAEAFHRLAIGKNLPREFYAQREELQQEWFTMAESMDDAQLQELSRKASRDESSFFGRWRGALLSSRKGGRLFLGAWKKRDLLINASLHRPEN